MTHILPNISRNKSYRTIRLGQLIEYNKKISYLESYSMQIESQKKPVPDHFLFFKKGIYEVKPNCLQRGFNIL